MANVVDDGLGHVTVLLHELVDGVLGDPDGVYVDVTGGFGGHSSLLLSRLGGAGSLIILDCDPKAVEFLECKFAHDLRVRVVRASFSDLKEVLLGLGIDAVCGVMADLGYSSRQLDDPERGLSFLSEGPLDMRLSELYPETALDVLRGEDCDSLELFIREYGEERHAKLLARKIKESVERDEIRTTKDLAQLAERVVGRFYRGQKIHPATRLFQALRIRVNRELEELDKLLEVGPGLLGLNGILGIISFHSLEDRRVKHVFRGLAEEGSYRLLNKRVIRPGEVEMQQNNRSRSAKLRLIQRNN